MAKLNDNQKSLAILGGGLVVALGAGYMAYADYGEYKKVREQREQKETQIAKHKSDLERTEPAKKEVVAYKDIVAANSKILPTTADIHNFGRFLGTLETNHNLVFKSLPSYKIPETSREPIVPIPMQISFSGTTRGFLRFLNDLESYERLVSVTSFTITPGQARDPGVDIVNEYNVQFTVYRYDAQGGAKDSGMKPDEEATYRSMREVKELIAEKSRPEALEKYQLMAGKDTRRDLFADPRASSDPGSSASGPRGDTLREELGRINALEVLLERADWELSTFVEAKAKNDYLKQHSARVSFQRAREDLEKALGEVVKRIPPFSDRSLMDRFSTNVDVPWKKLIADAAAAGIGSTETSRGPAVTVADAQGLLSDMQSMIAARDWTAAAERGAGVDAFVRDAAAGIEPAARPILKQVQELGERAKHQAAFARKRIVVKGIVRMPNISAVIVNDKTLLPGRRLDQETEFLRVEDSPNSEDGMRLVFSLNGHEVDYVQPKPELLKSDLATLED